MTYPVRSTSLHNGLNSGSRSLTKLVATLGWKYFDNHSSDAYIKKNKLNHTINTYHSYWSKVTSINTIWIVNIAIIAASPVGAQTVFFLLQLAEPLRFQPVSLNLKWWDYTPYNDSLPSVMSGALRGAAKDSAGKLHSKKGEFQIHMSINSYA